MKDWTGNARSMYVCNGASNHSDSEREKHDFYATEPIAVELLLQQEEFNRYVWECACGEGHMSEVLKANGYNVKSSDLYDRGYPGTEIIDFLQYTREQRKAEMSRDIITNPPYKYAKEFVQHALDISADGTKIAMFLKLTFLETKGRKQLFLKHPPKTVYVFSSRVRCGKNGDFYERDKNGQIKYDADGNPKLVSSAVAYAWYIWEKGFKGNPVIKWIN